MAASVDVNLLEEQASSDWAEDGRWLNIMFIGKYMSGKSDLAASIFDGTDITVDKALSATLRGVSMNNVTIKLWEFSQPTQEVAQLLGTMDLVICTLKMDDTRLRPEDVKIMQGLSKLGGPDLWKKGVIALTFANKVSSVDSRNREQRNKDITSSKYNDWKDTVFKEAFSEIGLDGEVMHKIPFIPAGHHTQPRLFGESWKSNFVKCLLVGMRESSTIGRVWRALKGHVNLKSHIIECIYFE